MGLVYERRTRGEELRHTTDDRLIGYALSETNLDFAKHDYEGVAAIANRQLDMVEARLRKWGN